MSEWTIATLSHALRARRVSPVEVTQACLARIERLEPRLRSFIVVDAAGALKTAHALDAELAAGRWRGPLHGIPLAYKDLFVVPGLPTSCGTKTREYFTDEAGAAVVSRLAEAGAITLGKLNMTELALGPFGDNAHHGDVQNPWRLGHASGGSSSGSGAAVAAGLAVGALGTDTGGSIRLPAACCGIVGLKPTYGRVSRAGVMPLSWSLDHVGPMTRTVQDATLLLSVIAGHDPRDATSSRRPVPDYVSGLAVDIAGLRVGVPENFYFDDLDPEVDAAVRAAARTLAGLKARVEGIRLPAPELLVAVSNVIARSESAAAHARVLKERPDELQPVVRARIEEGLRFSAYDYLQAARLRSRLAREFIAGIVPKVDALVAPVIPEPAPAFNVVKAGSVDDMVRRTGRFTRLTRPFNALGLPALCVPCGFSRDGRPLAFQVVGRPFDEATVLRIGYAYEQATEWHTRRVPLD